MILPTPDYPEFPDTHQEFLDYHQAFLDILHLLASQAPSLLILLVAQSPLMPDFTLELFLAPKLL